MFGLRSIRRLHSAAQTVMRDAAPSPTDYTMKIMAAANTGHFADALHYASRMKVSHVAPNISIYNSLLNLAARQDSWLLSWAIFDDMLHCGVKPTTTTYAHLIQAQRSRPFTNSWSSLQQMYNADIQPNPAIYTAIIEGLVAQGNLEMALHYLFLMKNQDILPELSVVQDVIILAAEIGYSQLAIELATYYEKTTVRSLGESVWIACLASSAQSHHVDGVTNCWSVVTNELKASPDEGICLSVLNMAARFGLPDLATDVLRIFKLNAVPWQEFHFAAVIEAFCQNGQLKEAFVTLNIMRTNDIKPLDTTSRSILRHINRDARFLDAAWALIDEIHADGTGIGVDALKVVIRASIFMGDLQRAVGIYKAFPDYGLSPDISVFNLLFDGCIVAQHRALGDVLLEDIKKAGLQPNIRTYEKMIQLCLTQDTYEDAFYYLEEMKGAQFMPPQSVYEALVEKCSVANDSRRRMVLEEMKECGYHWDPKPVPGSRKK